MGHRLKLAALICILTLLGSREAYSDPGNNPAVANTAPGAKVEAQPSPLQPYLLSPADEEAIAFVFGLAFVEEIRPLVFLKDLGDPLYKAAYIPSLDQIWLNSRVPAEALALVHEATHFYQRHHLGRRMKTDRIYTLPNDLSRLVDIEQEAMLTMAYAWYALPGLRGTTPCPPAPPMEAVRLYLGVHMKIKTSAGGSPEPSTSAKARVTPLPTPVM
jgi:hypothetical protein